MKVVATVSAAGSCISVGCENLQHCKGCEVATMWYVGSCGSEGVGSFRVQAIESCISVAVGARCGVVAHCTLRVVATVWGV